MRTAPYCNDGQTGRAGFLNVYWQVAKLDQRACIFPLLLRLESVDLESTLAAGVNLRVPRKRRFVRDILWAKIRRSLDSCGSALIEYVPARVFSSALLNRNGLLHLA